MTTTIIIYSTLSALAVMVVSLVGIIFVWKNLAKLLEKNLHYFVSFSAGVFIYVSFHLIEEALDLSQAAGLVGLFVAVGIIAFYLLDKILPESHHHHTEADGQHSHNKKGAKKMLIGDGIHNIGDGIILVPAFIISPALGLITAVGILIHEFIQEIAEFFVLKQAGYTTKQALIRNFAVSSTILIGLVLGFSLGQVDALIAPILGIAAGAFLYIVLVDLIPTLKPFYHQSKKVFVQLVFVFFLGLAVIFGVEIVAHELGLEHGHGHSHDNHQHNDYHDDDHHDYHKDDHRHDHNEDDHHGDDHYHDHHEE